jgi:hypothetical protein
MAIGPTAIKVSLIGSLINALDLVTGQAPMDYEKEFDFTSGTGANQAQKMFSDTRTLAASATENLDLSGSLADAFGATISFTKIKALIVKAAPGNTNDVVIGNAGGLDVASIFGAITHTLKVKPGGLVMLVAPDATGYAVTDSTADLLHVANSAGGTSVDYDILVLGV